jgi:hypothetical protein
MLLHQRFGRSQKENLALLHASEKHHESYDCLAQSRGHYYEAGGLKRCGGQIQLEEPLLYGLRL